jgi:hypothetical protein
MAEDVGWLMLEVCGAGIWLFELMVFGLSLEHPTATEQTMSMAAKMSAPVFLPQVMKVQVFSVLRDALVRVMFGHLQVTAI